MAGLECQGASRSKTTDGKQGPCARQKCADRDKELSELRDKLRTVEEREAALLVELSEIREQNELLEFRLLELEETPARRDSPDHAMDSGVVSPEPAHANKVSYCEYIRSADFNHPRLHIARCSSPLAFFLAERNGSISRGKRHSADASLPGAEIRRQEVI